MWPMPGYYPGTVVELPLDVPSNRFTSRVSGYLKEEHRVIISTQQRRES